MLESSGEILYGLENLEFDQLNELILFSCAKLFWTKALREEYQFEKLMKSEFSQLYKIHLLWNDMPLSEILC